MAGVDFSVAIGSERIWCVVGLVVKRNKCRRSHGSWPDHSPVHVHGGADVKAKPDLQQLQNNSPWTKLCTVWGTLRDLCVRLPLLEVLKGRVGLCFRVVDLS